MAKKVKHNEKGNLKLLKAFEKHERSEKPPNQKVLKGVRSLEKHEMGELKRKGK